MPWYKLSSSTRTRNQKPPQPNDVKIAADGAVWTEAALLHDAVEKVSLLFTEWQAALAHAVSVHHHPTSQGNVDPLQLYAKTWQFASCRSQTTCPRKSRRRSNPTTCHSPTGWERSDLAIYLRPHHLPRPSTLLFTLGID